MDDGDGRITTADGRQGSWWTDNDGTDGGVQFPDPNNDFTMSSIGSTYPLTGSKMAARTYGSGFTDWGATMAFDWNNVTPRRPTSATTVDADRKRW
jgi:hypothetical protein